MSSDCQGPDGKHERRYSLQGAGGLGSMNISEIEMGYDTKELGGVYYIGVRGVNGGS